MVVPVFVTFGLLLVYPLAYGFYISLRDYNIVRQIDKFVLFKNYIELFHDKVFLASVYRNLIYVGGVVAANFLVGLGMALLINKGFKGRSVVTLLLILPMLLVPSTAAVLWRFLYDIEFGSINHILDFLGLGRHSWLGSKNTALYAVMVADIWASTPYVFLILLAGLRSLPQDCFEAARMDGASSWQLFRYITLPLLFPIIMIVVIFKTVDTFKAFDYLWVMTRGGPGRSSHIISTYTYEHAFQYYEFGSGASMSIFTTIIILMIVMLFMVILAKKRGEGH